MIAVRHHMPAKRKKKLGMRGSCTTGKLRYPNRAIAQQALAKFRRQDSMSHTENRAYECPLCAGWHLTKQQGKR